MRFHGNTSNGRSPGPPGGVRDRLRPRRPAERNGGDAGTVDETLVELALLREENARLKAAPHQLPSFDRVVDEARSRLVTGAGDEDAGDEAAEMLVETIVLRDALVEVCEELERSLASVRAKLARVGTEAAGRTRDARGG